MGYHPINLALRFFLELAAFYFIGRWGWVQPVGFVRYVLAIGLPMLAATLWGVFRVPNDGGAPVVRVSGVVRLLIEALVFGFATWGLFDSGATTAGWIFGGITLLHYLISYDRIHRVLLQ
jgi:hypothetical protein